MVEFLIENTPIRNPYQVTRDNNNKNNNNNNNNKEIVDCFALKDKSTWPCRNPHESG